MSLSENGSLHENGSLFENAETAAGGGRPYRVSEITAQVKSVLEEILPMCWVAGEISDFTHHASGHRYFTLKDEKSQLSCVLFRWQARGLRFSPEAGMEVMAYGHLSVYEPGGRYQFLAKKLRPAGIGDMAQAFGQLKRKLHTEGLFDTDRKRPLPDFPRAIGIVTSPSGAAIRDIIQVLSRRAPGLQLVVRPARVQGPGAAEEIARGIEDLNRYGNVDILIVGRGGGAPEDLWPFNEEGVARAIFASERPVISAVGHEIDHTIADYVADYRAPTPSAAAEVVAQDQGSLNQKLANLQRRLHAALERRVSNSERQLEGLRPERIYARFDNRIQQGVQYVDERRNALAAALDGLLRSKVEPLSKAATRLEVLSPLGSLARGYSICQNAAGRLVRASTELSAGDQIRLRFHQGGALCKVEETIDE